MISCGPNDFMFPLIADVYYPIVEQSAYGNVKKTWILDRNISCNFNIAGSATKEEVIPNVDLKQESMLLGRVKEDVRISSRKDENAITNVLITNIRNANGTHIYLETTGPRKGKSTIFEIATQQPYVGPFGSVEYYKLVIRRSENQAVDV